MSRMHDEACDPVRRETGKCICTHSPEFLANQGAPSLAPAGDGLTLAESMHLWDTITKYLGACGVTKVPAWDPARDAAAAEVEKAVKAILLKRSVIIESRTASPSTVQAPAAPKERKVCHSEVATGSVMPKRVCRTVSTDPTERLRAERDLDRVRDRQQYGQQMGDVK